MRASRISDVAGTVLILVGALGFIAAGVLTWWIIHDIDKLSGFGTVSTASKLQTVAVVGLTPGMLSLIVIAFGVYLQTRSTDILLGVAVDTEPIGDEDDEEEIPEPQ
jgi:hypothetical protein